MIDSHYSRGIYLMPSSLLLDEQTASTTGNKLVLNYEQIRKQSELICAPLETEDYCIQTMPDVSPAKWHLAHTSWFFETFLLEPFLPSYRPFHPDYQYLFNSYYEQVGAMHPRSLRGQLSRPTVAEVYRYRAWIDEQLAQPASLQLPHVQSLLTAGRRRPVELFEQVGTHRVTANELIDVDPQLQSLANLNTPEDYEAALRDARLA